MSTYLELKSQVMTLVDAVGQSEVGAVVEQALTDTATYLATKMEVPALIKKSSYTALTSSPISLGSLGFSISSSYQTPNRLFVKQNAAASDPGVPYEYVEPMVWLDMQAVPGQGYRTSLFEPGTLDVRPDYAYTVNIDSAVEIEPLEADNVVNFYYNTAPAAYSDSGTPEIPSQYHYLVRNGAIIIAKEWVREPEALLDPFTVLKQLDDQIRDLDIAKRSNRRREAGKLSSRYQI